MAIAGEVRDKRASEFNQREKRPDENHHKSILPILPEGPQGEGRCMVTFKMLHLFAGPVDPHRLQHERGDRALHHRLGRLVAGRIALRSGGGIPHHS